MCSQALTKDEQMVRYYGHYINVVRGKRKKTDADDKISHPGTETHRQGFPAKLGTIDTKNLRCRSPFMSKVFWCYASHCFHRGPGCNKKILKHLDLWNVNPTRRSLANAPSSMSFPYTTSGRVPARMITSGMRITLQRPIFKNRTRAFMLPMPKILYFQAI